MQKSTYRCLAAIVLCLCPVLLAQETNLDPAQPPEGIPVESDWLYRQHYAQVQQIMQLPLSERGAKLEAYYKKLQPKAKMQQYMPSFFAQVVKDYEAAGMKAEAKALTAKMLEFFPQLKPSPEQELQQAYQNRNYAKVIELGEKAYAAKPDSGTAAMLAHSYIATQNAAKAVEYSQKALSALGPKEGVYFAVWLAEYYTAQQDAASALKYYDQLVKAFPTHVPQGWEAARWSQILSTAHSLKARNFYINQDYKAAIDSYYKSLEYSPRNEQAYLYIGLAHWKLKEMPEAMAAFATATVLKGPGSAKARGYLEQIYKARNNDSLEGLDKMLAEAKQALN